MGVQEPQGPVDSNIYSAEVGPCRSRPPRGVPGERGYDREHEGLDQGLVAGCRIKGCTGNVSFWDGLDLGFSWVHHKSCWSWGQPISGLFPRELVDQVLRPYLVAARPVLAVPGVQTFFVNTKGYPFGSKGLAIYYANMLRRRCQVPQRITPGRVRHLMVTFANNNPAVFGGREDVVASVMGHHVRMWREVYDKAVNRRNVELAAEAVAAVRRTVIAELEEVQRQAADAAMIAAAAAAVLAAAEAVGADVGQPVDGEGESQYVSALAEVEESGEEVEGGLDTLAAAAVEAAAAAAWAEADEEAAAAELDVSEDECMEMLFTSDDEDCLIDGEGEEE